LHFAIVSGSQRPNSESARVATWLSQQLEIMGHTTWILDLGESPLPLLDPGFFKQDPPWDAVWPPVAHHLREAQGLIAVSPEWHGMVPAALKNFFLLASHRELGHKPGLIVSVSASRNGAYPVAELRMSSTKNNRLCWIPEQLIVREAKDFGTPAAGEYVHDRARYALGMLAAYAAALQTVRDSGVIDHDRFANGM